MMTPHRLRSSARRDEGVSLVLSLLFMLVLSALGTAMLVLSRSETLSSVNYRMMSQARFGAESGVHKAAHFLLNSYTVPGSVSDLTANYNTTVTPVTYGGQPVVLSALADVTATYPLAGTQAAFASAAQGSLPVGDATVQYSASATMLSMRTVIPYASITPVVVQTWQLTARGTIEGARSAVVEVSAVIERHVLPTFNYGLFAVFPGCGALSFSSGNTITDSYDSANITLVSGLPVTTPSGGHVGTNGNLTEGGQSIVRGKLSTPRSGVGNCRSGAVTALDANGQATVQDGLVKLPQALSFADPDVPSPLPPTTSVVLAGSSNCASIPLSSGSCSMTTPVAGVTAITLTPNAGTPMPLPSIQVTAGNTLVLNAGTYDINSLKLVGNSILRVGSGPVILNVAGTSEATPIDLEGGSVTNTSFISTNFRILYAGTGTLKLTGGAVQTASVYAPKAAARVAGGAHLFGGIVAYTVTATGGAKIHLDKQLSNVFSVGPQMMSVFTWKEQ